MALVFPKASKSNQRCCRRGIIALSVALFFLGLTGCSNPEIGRIIMRGPEGSGIMGAKFFEVLAVYSATPSQEAAAAAKAQLVQETIIMAARTQEAAPGTDIPQGPPTPEELAKIAPVLLIEVEDDRKQGAATVVAWDTRSGGLASPSVYDIKKAPPSNKNLEWQTRGSPVVSATYIGADWKL